MALQDEVRRIVESRPSLPPRTDFEWRNTTDGLVHQLMQVIDKDRAAVLAVCEC